MREKKEVTFKGNPVTLVGRVLHTGAAAPDFRVTSQDMKEVLLSEFDGKIKVLTSFLSLDTPVCDLQVKEFNKRAATLSKEVVLLGISKDLPFAQQRFCASFDIELIKVVSDYKTSSFGINYGLLIKEMNLLARAVIILDKNNIVRYIQIVPELTKPPDYAAALSQLDEIIKSPPLIVPQTLPARCKPCEIGTPALINGAVEKRMVDFRDWELIDHKVLSKKFIFSDFSEAKCFIDLVAVIAEEQGHHPTMALTYNKVRISLTTHAAGGLTDNDFIMAKYIDELET